MGFFSHSNIANIIVLSKTEDAVNMINVSRDAMTSDVSSLAVINRYENSFLSFLHVYTINTEEKRKNVKNNNRQKIGKKGRKNYTY